MKSEDEVHQVFYAAIQKIETKDCFKPQNHRIFKSKSFMYYSKFRNCLFPRSQKVPKISFTRICLSIFHVRPLKMLSQGWRNKGCKLQRVHVHTQFFGRETKDHLRCSLQLNFMAIVHPLVFSSLRHHC